MGTGIDFQCEHCNYRPSLCVGTGMKFDEENIFQKDLERTILYDLLDDEREYKRFSLAAASGGVLQPDYGYKVYRCEGCGDLHNHFYMQVKLNGQILTPRYTCRQCRILLVKMDDEEVFTQIIHCPLCEEGKLQVEGTYLWD
ncbi:hypothetical protein [Alkalicoccus daliensis]|uniref:Uncharacterized protein n=1 Tax=Alkalicoccus daliensis TaxID=745820 RepID=A0A1H0FYK3_9BACI|nr:hypothetical protein [Alkalicoccus daliensis]SDN99735.1 hypothetical protein SAMN04488053_105156 [Alkalicoccus daliensis]